MKNEKVTVLTNKPINSVYWKLVFESQAIAKLSKPGHFLNLKVADSYDPLLRRPFSIFRIQGKKIEILYEVVGRGTDLLSRITPKAQLDVLGPLGSPFSKPKKKELSILVGGGIGVAPLMCWDEVYKADYLLMGFATKSHLIPAAEFKNKKSKKLISTDDGSAGKKGFVSEILKDILEKEKGKPCYIRTCGPTPMMDAVRFLSGKYGVSGELSAEEKMACGIGACLGCVVKTKDGFKTCCKDGPVFSFDDFTSVTVTKGDSHCGCSCGVIK